MKSVEANQSQWALYFLVFIRLNLLNMSISAHIRLMGEEGVREILKIWNMERFLETKKFAGKIRLVTKGIMLSNM